MKLQDIGIILAETSRSIVYLDALVKNGLRPNHALILKNNLNSELPGQNSLHHTSRIYSLLNDNSISYDQINTSDINSKIMIKSINNRKEEVLIYSGYGGAILRKDLLNLGKKFLHIHGGYLPDFKGSTTNFYSILINNSLGASAIFLSEKIDSGPILLRKKFPVPSNKFDLDHTLDSEIRAKVLVECIDNYLKKGFWDTITEKSDSGETYYIIHPVLKHLAILK